LEEDLRSLESLSANSDNTTVRKLIRLDEDSGLKGKLALSVDIQTNIAEFLLDLANSLEICSSVEVVSTELEQLDKVLGDIASSNIKTLGQVGKGESLINRNNVGHTITRIDDNTGQKSWGK
jgi:hypothetical protein